MAICPQCSNKVAQVYPVDPDLRDKIKRKEPGTQILDEICRSCINELKKRAMGAGAALLADEVARDERKKKMWSSRTALIRRGHALMGNQMYSEAAATYEKYLKLLELIFDCPTGELSPESLKDSAKTAELTIIVGVYWDLLRIYDTSDQHTEKQINAAKQLAKFVPLTPVFPDMLKKAESYAKNSKHPDVVRIFLNSAKKKRTRCFVATSAFESPLATEVQFLRSYRDLVLKKSSLGRNFIIFYYKFSPYFARFLDRNKFLKPYVRGVLRLLIKCVS